MKEKQHIDQWLKQSSAQSSKVPYAPVWEKIEATLDKNKRKKIILWWTVASLFFIAAIGTIGYIATSKSEANQTKQVTTVNNNPKSLNTDKTKANSSSQDNLDINEHKTAIDSKGKEETSITSIPETNTKATPKEAKTAKTNKSVVEDVPNIVLEDKAPIIPQLTEQLNPLLFTNRKPSLLDNPVALTDLQITTLPFVAIENISSNKPKSNINSNILTFGLSAGIAPIKNNLSIDLNTLQYVHMDYLGLRKNGETPNLNFSYGAYLRKDIRRFTIQLGFNYLTQGYHQNYDYLITKIPITNQFGTSPDKNGKYPLDDQTPYLNSRNPKNIVYSGNVINTNVDIPLNLGYKVIATKNWSVIPNMGLGLNLMQQSGAANTIDYQNLKLINYDELFVLNKRAYTFNTGILVERKLYKSLNFTFQPYYHQFITSNTSVVAQKTQQYGVNIGLNIKWQKK